MRRGRDFLLLLDPVVLELDEVVFGTEVAAVALDERHRLRGLSIEEVLRELAREAGRKAYESARVFLDELFVDARLIVHTLGKRLRGEDHEVAIALFVLRDQDEVIVFCEVLAAAAAALGAVARGDVELAPDERLDPLFAAFLVKAERAEHIAMVGDREGLLAHGLGVRDHFFIGRGPIEEGVVGVDVKVDEILHATMIA